MNNRTPEPLIEVHIPNYDTTFTYGLKFGDIAAFSDNNKLELADRAQLTDFVGVINARLIRLNKCEDELTTLKRQRDELVNALNDLSDHQRNDPAKGPGWTIHDGPLKQLSAALKQRDELKAFANSVVTQANGDLTDKAFRPYVKALAINTLASL